MGELFNLFLDEIHVLDDTEFWSLCRALSPSIRSQQDRYNVDEGTESEVGGQTAELGGTVT